MNLTKFLLPISDYPMSTSWEVHNPSFSENRYLCLKNNETPFVKSSVSFRVLW